MAASPLDARKLEAAADDVLAAFGITGPPIDPFAIAKSEGIALLPGSYDDCFDGRIEYRKSGESGNFYLLYAEAQAVVRPITRVRFSVAHELGHFYLPHHREYLLSGHRHGSKVGFYSDEPMEREADLFAVNLLMPRKSFDEQVSRKSGKVCDMRNLSQLAEQVFNTSLLSTVIRYVQLGFEPSCIVVSRNGKVTYSVRSDEMRELGTGWVAEGSRLPRTSVTAKALDAEAAGRPPEYGAAVSGNVWFQQGQRQRLWEECRVLGRTGLVLTFIVIDEENSESDFDADSDTEPEE